MMKLAHMDGEFFVAKMDTAKGYDLLNGPLDGYIASWKVPAAPKGKELVTIADFFFVEQFQVAIPPPERNTAPDDDAEGGAVDLGQVFQVQQQLARFQARRS